MTWNDNLMKVHWLTNVIITRLAGASLRLTRISNQRTNFLPSNHILLELFKLGITDLVHFNYLVRLEINIKSKRLTKQLLGRMHLLRRSSCEP